jgi:dUTPase
MSIKFLKIRDVKSPTRAYEFDAGIDFYVPEFNKTFLDDLLDKNESADLRMVKEKGVKYIEIPPQSRIMIPSGIKSRMAKPGRALIAANKSGIATKHGLVYGAQVVDYTYKGEIHLSLINTSSNFIKISGGMKILQFLETPVFNSIVEVFDNTDLADPVDYEGEFYNGLQDDRGADGFGSTDKK